MTLYDAGEFRVLYVLPPKISLPSINTENQDCGVEDGASKVHPKLPHPSNALFIQASWGSCWCSPAVLTAHGHAHFCGLFFYGGGAYGVFVWRRKLKDVPRPYKVFGNPFVPAQFCGVLCALVVDSIVGKNARSRHRQHSDA
ncbi:hypothetical protein FQR65_LT20899 [Abscondita terminalis]|nr:hypothetical protein FQR65_LT20899 [Abscondita terminalis]